MEQTDLGAILDTPTAAPEQAQQPEPIQREAPTGDNTQAAVPPTDASQAKTEPAHVPREALQDERRKRQEVEKRLREIEARMQQAQQPQEQPNWYADPEAAARQMHQMIERSNFETKVALSEAILMERHEDYAQMRDLFADEAAEDPHLAAQLIKSPNPAKFAYDMGKKIALRREIGDNPDSYRQKIEAEILKKYGIDPAGGAPAQAQPQNRKPAAPVPRSLALEPSAPARAPNGRYVSNGPTPLEDIIG
jgi:hypothetical protein